jgi:hypothetical protein
MIAQYLGKGHKEHEVFSREEKKKKRRGKPQD